MKRKASDRDRPVAPAQAAGRGRSGAAHTVPDGITDVHDMAAGLVGQGVAVPGPLQATTSGATGEKSPGPQALCPIRLLPCPGAGPGWPPGFPSA